MKRWSMVTSTERPNAYSQTHDIRLRAKEVSVSPVVRATSTDKAQC